MENRFWNHSKIQTKVKICNISSLEIAFNLSDLGVDALGFHIKKGLKFNDSFSIANEIVPILKKNSSVSCWLLTDIYDINEILKILEVTKVDTVQFQGKIYIDDFKKVVNEIKNTLGSSVKIVKTISLGDGSIESNIELAIEYSNLVNGIIVDTKWEKGGSGIESDYSLISILKNYISVPIIVAGGLSTVNIKRVILTTKPYGVDVQSGVERKIPITDTKTYRYKDISKCHDFINICKSNKNE